jgi:broad specificity phosphatase PhoE
MLLYIIRHGEPDYLNDTLTDIGKKQAEALSERLLASGINRIFTSPLGRAVATALPSCKLLKLDYTIENWCREDDAWNDFSGLISNNERKWVFQQQNTLLKNDNTIKCFDDWYKIKSISFVNAKAGMERIEKHSDEFLNRLGYERKGSIYKILRHNEEKVAVFCHQGFALAWI